MCVGVVVVVGGVGGGGCCCPALIHSSHSYLKLYQFVEKHQGREDVDLAPFQQVRAPPTHPHPPPNRRACWRSSLRLYCHVRVLLRLRTPRTNVHS